MPPSRQQRIRAYAAALGELASGIASSSDLAADSTPLTRLLQQVAAAKDRLSLADCVAAFGPDEQAVAQAALRAFKLLADERHDRSPGWLQLLEAPATAYSGVMYNPAGGGDRDAWLLQQLPGSVALALVVQLLGGVTSVVSAAPTSRSVERPAAVSLICLACGIMYPALRQSDSLPAVAAAMELADLLLNGGVGSGRQGGCSCGLADAAASSSARRPSPAVVRILAPLLSRLEHLQAYTSNEDAAAQRLLASKGSHALIVRHLAWHVAAARASAGPQRGGHGTASGAGSSSAASAAGAVPACADLVPFLAGWEGAPTLQAGDALSPLTMTMRTLTWQLEAGVGAPAACPRCTPAQMLLVLEGAARWSIQPAASSSPGGVNRAAAHAVNVVRNLSLLFSALVQAEPAWLSSAAYAVPAARVLAAWLQAAAQKLAENAPTSAAGLSLASSSESVSSGDMRGLAGAMVLALFHVLLTPGGVIEAHSQHSQVPVQQLLGSCELLLRTDSRDVRELSVPVGLGVLEGIVTHRPSWLEDMWRCGALPGLVVSAVKAISAGARDLARMARLLDAMLPLPVFGHQLWDATSSERQQFVMFALARVSGAVAALAIGGTEGTPGPELAEAAMIVLWSAAQQLGGQPLLRQQLEVAAPALLARADAVAAAAVASQAQGIAAPDAPGLSAAREPLRLLVDLGRQLDPLALGLSLPGCHNPACTSLAGVSEAAMPLKRCMGCKVARYCNTACAKAHWKYHKASCKRLAAEAGGQQQG